MRNAISESDFGDVLEVASFHSAPSALCIVFRLCCSLEYGLGGAALSVRGRGVGGVPPVLAARLGTGGALGVRVPGVDGWLGVGGLGVGGGARLLGVRGR